MAEVEYKGIKIGGNKLLLILPLIGTLGGGLWAGFEFYKDYMNMRSKIERYTAPDLSGFDKKLAVMAKSVKETRREMVSVRTRVGEIQTVTRDIREDTRADAGKLYSDLSAVEARSRALDSETRGVVRVSEEAVRGLITKSEKVVRGMISVSKKSGQDAAEALATRLDNKINAANVRFDAKLGQMDTKLDALEKRLKNTSKEHLSSMKKSGVNMQGVISRNEKTVRDVVESAATRLDNKINSANTRFDTKITQVDSKLDALEKRIFKALKRALDNPILRNK